MFAEKSLDAIPQPHGLRQKIRDLTRRSAIFLLNKVRQDKEGNFLCCLYCHYLFADQRDNFRRIILHLKSLGNFIGTDDCLDILENKKTLDGRYFHLSFDDGFRNIVANALPILQELAVPAIFFVPTAIIGADYETVKRYCLDVTHHRAVIEMADWDDLKRMRDAGLDIGSHTRTHKRLATLDHADDLLYEIAGSKHDIETKLGYSCRYISWPYGRLSDTSPLALQLVRETGYRACFGAFRGTVKPGETDRWQIPRHHFEPQWPLSHVHYFVAKS